MSWSLEIFSPRDVQIKPEEVAPRLARSTPPLALQPPVAENGEEMQAAKTWSSLVLSEASGVPRIMGGVQAILFESEREADPQLLGLFEAEIVASDAEDGTLDDEYTDRLRKTLEETRWHYIVSVQQNSRPEQERAVVLATNALAHASGGIVHDLQTGAWMDADLFENLLDAYGVSDTL
jgi:hypothetical protein